MEEIAVKIENVSKEFNLRHNCDRSLKSLAVGIFNRRFRQSVESFSALKDINIEIPKGKVHGIVGHNGSGKSTLLRIVAGILMPTEGRVVLPENALVGAMIQLGAGFSPELSGSENIFLNTSLYGISREEVNKVYDKIVEFSELEHFIDTPLKNYSSGMTARLGFSIIAYLPMEIVLIDEVFAVGDEAFKNKCKEKMHEFKEEGRTMMFVSHSAPVVEEFCDQACLLYKGEQLGMGDTEKVLKLHHQLMARKMSSEDARKAF